MKWAVCNNILRVSQKKSGTRGPCIPHLKVTEGQVGLSTVLGTRRVYINTSFLVYFDSRHNGTFKELRENLHHGLF